MVLGLYYLPKAKKRKETDAKGEGLTFYSVPEEAEIALQRKGSRFTRNGLKFVLLNDEKENTS
jgi:hypothetical protein